MPVSSVDSSLRRAGGNITDEQRHGHMVAPPMKTSVICQTPMPGMINRYDSLPVSMLLSYLGCRAKHTA
jgi:hypothetical protein